MSTSDPRGFLMRFEDGPLQGRGNITNALGGADTFRVSAAVWTWPLPDRLGVLAHLDQTENVAMWDADGDGDGLPEEIWRSPNAVVYRKVSESQMPHGSDFLARGALYRLADA